MAHVIRLREPWDVSPADGRTRHARNFGRPRGPDPCERVWLVCGHVPGPAEVLVNGQPLGRLETPGPFAADVTELLLPRNHVAFVVASAAPLGPVSLEIRGEA